jgi:mannonate dehydratase
MRNKRRGAEADHSPDVLARARAWFDRASESDKSTLLASIMAGLPGAFDRYDIPAVVSSGDDLAFITSAVASDANGITFCTGSLGAGSQNDVPALARQFGERIHFVHLRNVAKEPDGSFMEADHLGGDTDMVSVVEALLKEQGRRRDAGHSGWRIPFRPDHGHELLDDAGKKSFPGYSTIGRLKGLAEIRGVMTAVAQLRGLPV